MLRKGAIANTLFPPTTLNRAIEELGFLQADPIRSPARAQDLILRHRVKNYRSGDLENLYPKLKVDEDFLFAYGFLPRSLSPLLDPRESYRLSKLEKELLDHVGDNGSVHPQELETAFGSVRTRNGWGGFPKPPRGLCRSCITMVISASPAEKMEYASINERRKQCAINLPKSAFKLSPC